eukprot:CAMPEP_0113305506 /NCGR_PEP_ID=MMETSP0010_2-20120614/5111_1 /TAXON_ID=216773 ORGANISM="Corethron hystrix, Strain 308" /NCGR_SAMPLE_ID=MMETSP0010_2 /ASSEMBLY_ACC=CAM_ASM_000155 /LENGTH=525 /DNA_ID=CAMNT_0000159949 /DNA_START=280 /DNA_END=1857 /DNA_ORIENTATION=+ /assembly_acc=CAM_ASM_000155
MSDIATTIEPNRNPTNPDIVCSDELVSTHMTSTNNDNEIKTTTTSDASSTSTHPTENTAALLDHLKQLLEDAKNRAKLSEEEAHDLSNALVDAEKEKREVQYALESLKKDFETEKEKFSNEIQFHITNFENKVKVSEENVQGLSNSLIEAIADSHAAKTKALKEAEENTKELENVIKEQSKILQHKEEIIEKYEVTIATTESKIAQLREELETSQEEFLKTKNYAEELVKKVAELDEGLKKENESRLNIEAESSAVIAKMKEEMASTLTDFQAVKRELQESEEKIKDLEETFEIQSKDLCSIDKKVAELDEGLKKENESRLNMEVESSAVIAKMEEEMASTLADFQAVKRELQESEEKMKDLEETFEIQSEELCSKDNAIEKYMKERKSLSKIAKLGLNLAGDKTKDSAQTIAKRGKNLGRQASSRGRNLAREARSRSRSLSRRFKGKGQVFDDVENRETDDSKEITQESNVSNDESQENATIAEEPKNSKVVEVKLRFPSKSFMKTNLKTKKNNVAEQAEVSVE